MRRASSLDSSARRSRGEKLRIVAAVRTFGQLNCDEAPAGATKQWFRAPAGRLRIHPRIDTPPPAVNNALLPGGPSFVAVALPRFARRFAAILPTILPNPQRRRQYP